MAKLVEKILTWNPPDDDTVSHRVYVSVTGANPDYTSFYTDVPAQESSIKLPFLGMPLIEGKYIFGVSAVDDAGNESDLSFIEGYLDFLAPSPPTGLLIF